jgi:hypothetical protein
MTDRRLDASGDPGHGPVVDPDIWRPPDLPDDLRRMGLTRNTEEGAWIEFASMLNPSKRSHVAIAWLILLTLFGIPLLMSVSHLLGL